MFEYYIAGSYESSGHDVRGLVFEYYIAGSYESSGHDDN